MNKINFESICQEMIDLQKRKNKDYGDSFGMLFKEFGLTSSVIRLSDKLNRLKQLNLNNEQQVKDESIEDTLIDLACYSIMTIVELKK